ncbi:MAG: ferrous iron transporter B [Elusimicrobiota bacterium]|nr:ferrous iron transporter B [Elusimicrobiota bacterium]
MKTNPTGEGAGPIILVGHSKTGKTSLFSLLSRKTGCTGCHHGTCVETGRGNFSLGGKSVELIDAPGVSGINGESEEYFVLRDLLLREDPLAIVLVGDAKDLRRTLLLAIELGEYGTPAVLALNMADESRRRGITIDLPRLASLLNAPVVETTAARGEGAEGLVKALAGASAFKRLSYGQEIEEALKRISALLSAPEKPLTPNEAGALRAIGLRLLCEDKGAEARVLERWGRQTLDLAAAAAQETRKKFTRKPGLAIAELRAKAADEIFKAVQTVSAPASEPLSERLSNWMCRPLTGVPIALGVLGFLYLFVGWFGAQVLVGLGEGRLFGEIITPFCARLAQSWPQFAQDALIGQFGLVSVALTLAIGLVTPVLATFYFSFGLLEEVGYIPRLSILLNRILQTVGLNGKGIIPLMLGLNCVTAAVLSTRIFDTKKEKIIATLLVLGMPCAPLLAAILALFSKLPVWTLFCFFALIAFIKILTGMALKKLVPGPQADFIMELPLIRFPRLLHVLARAGRSTLEFLKEALPAFLIATFAVFLLDRLGALDLVRRLGAPVVKTLLGLPAEATEVFIMSAIRRESGAALLKQLCDSGLMGNAQMVVSLLVMTFLIPCVNSLLLVIKQNGAKMASAMVAASVCYAIFVGAAVHWVWLALGGIF